MFKCYDHFKLQNNILKCDQCKEPLNAYDQPKFLPCGETICSSCVVKIEKVAFNKKFKCNICLEDHSIPDNSFPINKNNKKKDYYLKWGLIRNFFKTKKLKLPFLEREDESF